MVTAKSAARAVGSALVAVVALPFVIAAAPIVAASSVVLANFPHRSRFLRLHAEIRENLALFVQINNDEEHRYRAYFDSQVAKYLRPDQQMTNTLTMDLMTLRDFFAPQVNDHRWSISGMESPCAHGCVLFMGFGHATINGNNFGDDALIRIAPKAFHLTNSKLSGVMLHEATHFVLATDDIAYDSSCWIGHEKLKELAPGEHYRNADNWRIFYQKMRQHFLDHP